MKAKEKRISVIEIISFLETFHPEVCGEPRDLFVTNLKAAADADELTLDWINPTRSDKQEAAENTPARVILAGREVRYSPQLAARQKLLIRLDQPKLALARVGRQFFSPRSEPGIHPRAVIHPEAEIGAEACIGANAVIGKCRIGSQALIGANVVIQDDVLIGDQVVIQAGAVVGVEGFGYMRAQNGELIKLPHLCGVEIGNQVEIGANCQIARGVFSNTRVGNGCKINGLCFIAHNCQIGENVLFTGNSMLAGSVRVEDEVTIYSNAVVREHLNIGRGAIIGMGAVVTRDVPAGETWIGNPARRMDEWKKE